MDAVRQFRRAVAEHGPIRAAIADRLDEYDLGRPICVRRRQFRRGADGGLLFHADVRRQNRRRSGLSDRVRPPAERSGRGEHFGLGHAGLSRRAVRGAVPGRRVDLRLVVGLECEHKRRDRARADGADFDQRQSAGVSTARPGLYDAERVRRVSTQRRGAAGRRHRRDLAGFPRPRLGDEHAGRARLELRAPSPRPTIR